MTKSLKPKKPKSNLVFKQINDIFSSANSLNDKLSPEKIQKDLSQFLPIEKVSHDVVIRFQAIALTFVLLKKRNMHYKRREQHLRDFKLVKSSLVKNLQSLINNFADLHCDHPDVLRAFLQNPQDNPLSPDNFKLFDSYLANLSSLLEHAQPLPPQKKNLVPYKESVNSLREMYKDCISPKIAYRKKHPFSLLVKYFFKSTNDEQSPKNLYLLITKS